MSEIVHVQYKGETVVAVFGCPQPDALDDEGKVICPGVPTVEVEDDHPDVAAFFERVEQSHAAASIEDIIAVLPKESKDALEARVAAKTTSESPTKGASP